MALMNRVQPRRPPVPGEARGGLASAQPSASQPELSAGVAPLLEQAATTELGATSGGGDLGTLPMPPLPPMPPGSNAPIALPGFQSSAPSPGGRSMMGAPPPGMDLFGGGGEGAGPDDELMRRILAGLPQRR